MKRDGFIFYESFRDATKGLPDDTRLALYDALMDYALYGVVPDITDSTVAGFFKLIRPQIDANIAKRENGKKGGRPAADHDASDNQSITEPEATENQSVTESEPSTNQEITEAEPKEKAKGKAKAKAKEKAQEEIYPRGFLEFWAAYPRKEGKIAAAKAFAKRRPDAAMLLVMLAAIARQKVSQQWQKDDGQFIPHPATWLNQGRWMDELPATTRRHGYEEHIMTNEALSGLLVDLDGEGEKNDDHTD